MNLDKEINLKSLDSRFHYFYFLLFCVFRTSCDEAGFQASVDLVEAGVRRGASATARLGAAGCDLASEWEACRRVSSPLCGQVHCPHKSSFVSQN